MKTKNTLVALLLTILTINTVKAQNELYFDGYVYYEDSLEKQTMIPFATIKLYEVSSPDKIVASSITAINGYYNIKGLDTYSKYIVKVSAPGINEQLFITRPNNGNIKTGNISTHTQLIVDKKYKSSIEKQSFTPDSFVDGKDLTIIKMIEMLPELEITNNDIMTKDGGSVRLTINGANQDASLFEQLKVLPVADVIKSMDYYDLSDFDDSLYDGVLNIRLTAGEEATPPSYRAISLMTYNK